MTGTGDGENPMKCENNLTNVRQDAEQEAELSLPALHVCSFYLLMQYFIFLCVTCMPLSAVTYLPDVQFAHRQVMKYGM